MHLRYGCLVPEMSIGLKEYRLHCSYSVSLPISGITITSQHPSGSPETPLQTEHSDLLDSAR